MATFTTEPAAPSSLSLDTSVENEISLSWTDNSSGESGHRVYHSTDGSSFSEIASLAANTTAYTHTGLTDGTKHWYYVAAYTSGGESVSSTQAGTTALPAPTVSISQTGDDITVSWTDNSDNTNGFYINRGTASGSLSQHASVSSSTSSHTDSGLLDGERYFYTVEVYTSDATSVSTEVAATTDLPEPKPLSIDAINGSSLELSWSESSDNEDGFRVYYSTDGGSTFTQDGTDLSAGTTTYTTEDAAADSKTYTYKVASFTEHAESESTAVSEILAGSTVRRQSNAAWANEDGVVMTE
jgi:hypothetical protein